MTAPVVVVGAGPAGLAAAVQLSRRGLDVVVCEQQSGPPDKACGEGVLPAGVAELERLGILAGLGPADCHRISSICYVQEDGGRVSGRLPAPGGLGIRRTALTRVLAERAAATGASLRWNCRVQDVARTPAGWRLATTAGPLDACLLVAADGLHSPLRHRAGLAGRPARRHRFGLRGHYRLRPWSDEVEVHLRPGLEAFVTPVGSDRVGLAFLWERGRAPAFEGGRLALPALLANYPQLAARLGDARLEGAPRSAGPLAQRATACVADRLVLLGDAAGYVDAITGEGLSLAFAGAAVLAAVAPDALARGADADALRPYARAHARLYRRYALVTGAVLGVARRPRLRRPLLRWLARRPTRLETLIRWGLG